MLLLASMVELPSVGLLRALAPAEDALQKLHTDVKRRARDWSPPGVDERFSYHNVLLYLLKYQDMDAKQFTDAHITSIMISLGLEQGPDHKALSRVRSALNRQAASRS